MYIFTCIYIWMYTCKHVYPDVILCGVLCLAGRSSAVLCRAVLRCATLAHLVLCLSASLDARLWQHNSGTRAAGGRSHWKSI